MRKIDVCMIQKSVGECAAGKKNYKLEYPAQMMGWTCWDLESQMLLGDRLQQCEQDGRLPHNDKTWDEMHLFIIPSTEDLEAHLCTNPDGVQKITSKLSWCASR